MHGPADALAYGVKVTGCTLFFVDEGVDTGPIVAQAAVRSTDDDTAESLHERIKVAERALLVDTVGAMARRGLHHPGQEGPPWTDTDARSRSGERWSRSTTSPGSRSSSAGLHEAGVALVSTGGSAALIEGLGLPVTKVEELTGFPECLDGRVKTLHPKVHAGILADRRLDSHVQQLAELGIEPFDLVVSNLYPFRQTVASGASARRVRRADRHRRPVDGPRGGQEPPLGRDRHLARRGTPTCSPRSPRAASRWPSGSGWPPRRSPHTATYDVAVANWMGNVLTDTSDGTASRRGRRDVGEGRRAALRREPAPAGGALRRRLGGRPRRRRAAARQGDVLQQLRRHRRGPAGGPRLRRPGGGDHQARQPVRHRGRRGRGRGAPQGARVRPDVGVRRRDRGEPAGLGGDGRAGAPRSSPR